MQKRLKEFNPDGKLIILDDVSHYMHLEKAKKVVSLISQIVEEIRRSSLVVVGLFCKACIPEKVDHLKPVLNLELPVDTGHVIPDCSDGDEQFPLDIFV